MDLGIERTEAELRGLRCIAAFTEVLSKVTRISSEKRETASYHQDLNIPFEEKALIRVQSVSFY